MSGALRPAVLLFTAHIIGAPCGYYCSSSEEYQTDIAYIFYSIAPGPKVDHVNDNISLSSIEHHQNVLLPSENACNRLFSDRLKCLLRLLEWEKT